MQFYCGSAEYYLGNFTSWVPCATGIYRAVDTIKVGQRQIFSERAFQPDSYRMIFSVGFYESLRL